MRANSLDIVKSAHAATVTLLKDALGHQDDVAAAVTAMERQFTGAIGNAFAQYRAATAPDVIRKALAAAKRLGYPAGFVTAEGIRGGALDALRERLDELAAN